MNKWAVVVLAAGKGRRMNSSLPKVLHPLCGKEMVRYILETVQPLVDGPVVTVISPESREISNLISGSVEYVEQVEPKGTGKALLETEKVINERASNILVLYGDTPLITSFTLTQLMERHQRANATISLVTSEVVSPSGLGRIERDSEGGIINIIEESEATNSQMAIKEINGGVYAFKSNWLWPALLQINAVKNGEYYLTKLIEIASKEELPIESISPRETVEVLGVDNKLKFTEAESIMRRRILDDWVMSGVTIVDPVTTYVDSTVTVGSNTIIYPNTTLAGTTSIGSECHIGPNTMIYDSAIQGKCKVVASVLEDVKLETSVNVGPYSYLRSGAYLENGVRIGNGAEIKNSRIGQGTTMGHFGYIGDSEIGKNVNIGAGTVTCNFDGIDKHKTIIEDDVFIGSGTMLVAPVRIGARAKTGAGSVITRDVLPDTLVAGVPARNLHELDDQMESDLDQA